MGRLTKKQRRVLEDFAEQRISIAELRKRMKGALEFDFETQGRKLTSYYGLPVPGVRIEMGHVQAAMDKHARGMISTLQLADWATMLLLNDAYDWNGPKEAQIADWLSDIILLTLKLNETETI